MYNFHFAQPWWFLFCVLLAPLIWFSRRNLTVFKPVRRFVVILLRCLVILLLISLLAHPNLTKENQQLSLLIVRDRSQSVPEELQQASLHYLTQALVQKKAGDLLAVIDVAEAASISMLPSNQTKVKERYTSLNGRQSNLAQGLQMALAIAPPDTGARILLISDGNENAGDVKEAARIAAANEIPVDVLPLRYTYEREVIFKRLSAPAKARSGQTISLRFVLKSAIASRGKLMLTLNDQPVDLVPESPEVAMEISLKPGANVKTISLPVGTRGMHTFKAVFLPDDPAQDRINENNQATAMTYVAGPGHVLVVDADGAAGAPMRQALRNSDIEVRYRMAAEFPDELAPLMDTDAVILVDTDCSNFSYQQQEMLCRYVKDLGGGLIMVGGPHSYGAGGWIGSPVADMMPVDFDPPQKKQLPKGALVLIMHSCEMPQGNLWGERIALAAVKTLSRLDLVGILSYGWQSGDAGWVYPLSPVGDKTKVISAIQKMQVGDMPDLGAHLQQAYQKLKDCDAAQKHVIIISDGDPAPPTGRLLAQCKESGITCTGVAVFPHSPADIQSLLRVARATGGRFYNVKDPQKLPQIFIKEAQVVRRALIVEESFVPQTTAVTELNKGLRQQPPPLDGYVLTGWKGGLSQVVFASTQSDPVLASCQSGLGRCVAFTSSFDSRWASRWISWGEVERLWEQVVRWAGKPVQAHDCEVFTDVQGRQVQVHVEAIDAEGKFLNLENLGGRVIGPDMSGTPLPLTQVGPDQFQGDFQANVSGSYIVNLQYRKMGEGDKIHHTHTIVNVPFAPEFRDLTYNAPLLTEISTLTGGRVLPSEPEQAHLFAYSGVKFPETQLPLNPWLIRIWLVIFLLDVAVRRISLDFKAIVRRLLVWVRRTRGEKTSRTLEQLRITRKKLQTQLFRRTSPPDASQRYEAKVEAKHDLPLAPPSTQNELKTESPLEEKPKMPTKTSTEETSHIQQLLRAKREAADRRKKDNEDQQTSK